MTDGVSDDGEDEDEESFIVEKIITHKGKRPRKFLVQWEGYPPDEATWETEANLRNNVLLEEYLAALPAEEKKQVSRHTRSAPPTYTPRHMPPQAHGAPHH